MAWFGAGLDGPLLAVRAVHFAATSTLAGTLLFRVAVIDPGVSPASPALTSGRAGIRRVAVTSLAIAAVSGVLWLLLVAAAISGLPLTQAMTADLLATVITDTRFGAVAALRGGMAAVLAMALLCDRFAAARGLGLAMALGLTASIAWTGHAGSGGGVLGSLQLITDAGHLVAAAAWFGGLVALAMLLQAARRERHGASLARACEATTRFATIGLISVAVLLSTGLTHAWILVGSWHGLVASLYGRLLLSKLALLAATLAVAAVNRLVLTPRLQRSAGEPGFELLRQLKRNSQAEIGLLSLVYAVVGVLGTISPALPSS